MELVVVGLHLFFIHSSPLYKIKKGITPSDNTLQNSQGIYLFVLVLPYNVVDFLLHFRLVKNLFEIVSDLFPLHQDF